MLYDNRDQNDVRIATALFYMIGAYSISLIAGRGFFARAVKKQYAPQRRTWKNERPKPIGSSQGRKLRLQAGNVKTALTPSFRIGRSDVPVGQDRCNALARLCVTAGRMFQQVAHPAFERLV